MKITIPLSVVFFPITLPIALIRIAIAGVVAVIISPISLYTFGTATSEFESTFGYARKYTILKTKEMKKKKRDNGTLRYRVDEVRVRPGVIPYIAGAKPKIVKLWTNINPLGTALLPFIENGPTPSNRFKTGFENERKVVNSKFRDRETLNFNLETVRDAVDA